MNFYCLIYGHNWFCWRRSVEGNKHKMLCLWCGKYKEEKNKEIKNDRDTE